MKYKNIIIGTIFIVIIFIIITIIIILNLNKDSGGNLLAGDHTAASPNYSIDESEIKEDKQEGLQQVNSKSEYYMVKNFITKLYTYNNDKNNLDINTKLFTEEEIKQLSSTNSKVIYDMLDKEYINYKGITENNIAEKIDLGNTNIDSLKIYINDMYFVKQNNNRISVYLVNATILDLEKQNNYNIDIIINSDSINKTNSIILGDYIKDKIGKISNQTKIKYTINEIKANENNTFDIPNIPDETYIIDLYNEYKYNSLYNIEFMYNKLDNEYKKAKFDTLDKFKQYIEKNKASIAKSNISKYKKSEVNNGMQYVCLNDNNEYMYINAQSMVKYTYFLDTYTIDTVEFLKKYNEGNDQMKVGMNIEKIIDALNNKDYNYIYGKLNETFKNNNLKTVQNLQKYLEDNLFESNEAEYIQFSQEGNGVYSYSIKMKSMKEEKKYKNMTFVIKLKEGTDFEMSFSIE